MGWRTVVVSKSSKLDYKLGYMVVRDSEETIRVHISEISVLIIENTASSVTTALLNELTKQKIKVIFCKVLIIENKKMFETNEYESVIVLDEYLCEIVEI